MRAALFRAYLSVRGRPLLEQLARLEQSQWLSSEQIDAFQTRKLRALLAHAGSTVPYYRELFRKARLDPERVTGCRDLERLPTLDKETLAERFEDLKSERPGDGVLLRATGGSTGRPVRFLVDRAERTARSAHLYRNLRWLGWDLGGRAAYVWGSDADSKEHKGATAALRDAVAGVLWLNAFTLEDSRLDEYLDRLERFRPAVLVGYPSSLHLLAERALAARRGFKGIGVQSSAEMLAPAVRRDLAGAFGGPVLDRYGCREAGVVAHECPRSGLHVNAEAVVVEIVSGEVVLTGLNNYSMPLIRYRNEDLAELGEPSCPCGRGLPLLTRIQGRRSDVIVSPAGRLIHGEFFTHLFYDAPGVRRFQVRQVEKSRLEISVVGTEAFTLEARAAIERSIHDHADAAFSVAWNLVPEIPAGPSGKHRFTISDLPGRVPPAPPAGRA